MEDELTALEQRALEAALDGDTPWRGYLRRQLPCLRAVARQYTGVGFYTDFVCKGHTTPIEFPVSDDGSELVPVAWASHPDVEEGAAGAICFSVFLKEGLIVCLEGASGTAWPSSEDQIVFCS